MSKPKPYTPRPWQLPHLLATPGGRAQGKDRPMQLTEAELTDGRRLWAEFLNTSKLWPLSRLESDSAGKVKSFLFRHADALLSAAADAETIRREAVREFSEAIVAHLESSIPCQDGTLASADFWDGKRTAFAAVIRRLHGEAAARGATLDEKP